MEKIKKNFGFRCMRLPMKHGEIDMEQACCMVDVCGVDYLDNLLVVMNTEQLQHDWTITRRH